MPFRKSHPVVLLLLQGALASWGSIEAHARHGRHGVAAILVPALIFGQLAPSMLVWWSTVRKRRERCHDADLPRQLARALKKAEDLIENSSDMVWEIDAQGRFVFISDHNGIMGADWGIKIGMSVHELPERDPVTTREVWAEQLASNARGEPFSNFHYSLRRSDGGVSHFGVNGTPIHSETGSVIGFRGTTWDRTKQVEALHVLQHLSFHDGLTGLPNRRAIMLALEEMMDDARRTKQPLAVLLCDVDHFKSLNDHHGHQTGDRVLSLFGERLDRAVGAGNSAGRYGGEEFLVILRGDPVESKRRAAEISAAVTGTPYPSDGVQHPITISGGLAFLRATDIASTLIARADLALYQAKENGRNRIEPERDETAAAREAGLRRDLHAAPAHGEFEIHFQPVADIATGVITSYEALLRWHSPSRGSVMPNDFIPFAE